MNYHELTPLKYKRSIVSGPVHRIYRACSSWEKFHQSLVKDKKLLFRNQYPPSFFEPIITRAVNKLLIGPEQLHKESVEAIETKLIFLQYRGKVSEKFEKSLLRCKAPCKVIFTLRELRAVLPSLKAPIEMPLKSGVVFKISCPRFNSCWSNYCSRHLFNRIREHNRKSSPVGNHFVQCNV
mgnify:FL=1